MSTTKKISVGILLGILCVLIETNLLMSSQPFFLKGDKSVILNQAPVVVKIKDIVIYKDSSFFSAFPSVVKKPDGELLVAFRRAPDRRIFGEKKSTHVDPNSYLVLVRSVDGENWTKEPDLIYAHPFGGSQDPCLLQLRDGTLLCTSYGWSFVRSDGMPNLKKPYNKIGGAISFGGYLLRSDDGGETWNGPIYPPHIASEVNYNAWGQPITAYNRGALCETKNGEIFWVVAAMDSYSLRKTSTHLLVSGDKGLSWNYSCPVSEDEEASFNETSIYETPKGSLVAFQRTSKLDGLGCIARSDDKGKSFGKWKKMGFKGHPLHALRLPDNRVLLTYGYRYRPYGIRARILNPECTDFETAHEFVIRDDGGSTDIGYPWAVQLEEDRVLIVYYYNIGNGVRHIAGTIIKITKE